MDSELERILMRPLHRFRSRLEAVGVSLLLGFFVCAGIVAIFGLLAREIFSTARAGPLDQRITLSAPYLHNSDLDRAALTATFFGSHLFVLPATILVTAALLSKGHRVSALLFCGSVAGGFALNSLLKIAFHRVRPDLWRALVVEHTYSFPSGHAAVSTVFFGGLAAVVLHLSRRPVVRIVAVVLAAIATVTVAGTRVYLGAHWTTDVVGGILLGLFWVVVAAVGTAYVTRRSARSKPAGSTPPEGAEGPRR